MFNFDGAVTVITGAGDGMGRSLAVQLAAQGARLSLCDIFGDPLEETRDLCLAASPDASVVTAICDVSDEAQVQALAKTTTEELACDHVNLLFNNAGIAGGRSMIVDDRAIWERTFAVTWGGVYLMTRTFLPLLVAAERAWLVNTSSVNGFWASIGPDVAHTAYSTAKFAVKGFSEALITDLRLHAPHVGVSVVMPGHIGTGIASNTVKAHGLEADDEMQERGEAFRARAPMTADEAAAVILDGVANERWRILVGEDAHLLDDGVRSDPEGAYEPGFLDNFGENFLRVSE